MANELRGWIDKVSSIDRRALLGAAGLASVALVARGTPLVAALAATSRAEHGEPAPLVRPDGAHIFFKDWGQGPPVLFSHGWPLNADAWDEQMMHFAFRGFRAVAHDRRGYGRSTQTSGRNDLDSGADDLAALIDHLDLRGVTLIGHSAGGGEVARYIGRHGTARVAKVVLVSAIPPLMLRSSRNPTGLPISVFDDTRAKLASDRAQFYHDLAGPFFGANRAGAQVSQGVRDAFFAMCMKSGLRNAHQAVQAWSETDLTDDLRRIKVPTMIVHGSDDQLVPIANSAVRSAKIISHASLRIYEGAPHGLPVTHRDRFNADVLRFIRRGTWA